MLAVFFKGVFRSMRKAGGAVYFCVPSGVGVASCVLTTNNVSIVVSPVCGSVTVVLRDPKFGGDGGGLYPPTGGMKCLSSTSQKNSPWPTATAAITHAATGTRRHHETRRTGGVFTGSGGP